MAVSAEPPSQGWARPSLQVAWEHTDRHRGVVYVAASGLALAACLAIFGLPPLDLHGPLHYYFGIMDPLCGGTRGVRHAIRGEWGSAWAYNPISIPLVLGAAAVTLRHGIGKLTGRWLNLRLSLPRLLLIALVVLPILALEVNQQLHADLLMAP